ncbi:hypothetical protein [Erythrobacter neustonensis]|uniref:Uncharacterized protein n=1 Tax=Erythrobacter neustonensis TaxID=1112 RepID=A0A192D2U3_9SPHN|nr:hypothetical protein [Erythrobacter neustonensis]ANK12803.1 hypothetical protein A9D12_07430 [Erythrobacter neustonensis]
MGKGGYIGGGTIIGPHTPGWFGKPRPKKKKKPKPEVGEAMKASAKAAKHDHSGAAAAKPAGKRTHRRRYAPQPVLAKPKRELSAADERRIGKLRLHIKGLEQLRDGYQKQIDSALAELNGVLKEYGLPLERSGQK